MGQFLQERRAQQLPWHQQVWAGLDHPGTARIWSLFLGENPDSQDINGHGSHSTGVLGQHSAHLGPPSSGMTNNLSEICILKQEMLLIKSPGRV